MEQTSFENYLKDRYKNQLEYYSRSAGKNQKRYRQYQWLLIILSAVTPVFAAFNGRTLTFGDHAVHVDLQMLVIITSAVVAILTTGLKTFNYQELWVTYRSTYEKLKPEIHYYHFNVGPYGVSGVDKESLFVTRVETILDTEHSQWPPAKKMNDPKSDQSNDQAGDQTNDPTNADAKDEQPDGDHNDGGA